MAGKTTDPNPVVFDDRLKLLSLYSAIGPEGVTALEATGYDTNDDTYTYSDDLRLLIRIYDPNATAYISLQRFISAKQDAGEDELNYLFRIEQNSRCPYRNPPIAYVAIPGATDVINAYVRMLLVNQKEDVRSHLATLVAVNGQSTPEI